ncbi:hypothetical protein [Muricomes intestini]|uniref:Parvulin-like peptidyl-prolyl cis-trans isomerase protein n=1 Tax=Muricomes intestini TaxID=1796634 RepID=A0A4R3KGF5_9FIRM|nr:hypothetical protein [Muricomes intestini]TCS82398.1 hypothetical protein EDD59_102269 [Muricomes intestini]HAX50409.1 hypothetical protein [Lachnospiraceae bacterium]
MKKPKRKRRLYIGISILLAIAILVIALVFLQRNTVYARVGEYKITEKDLKVYSDMEKSTVMNYFHNTHHKELNEKEDWYEETGGEKPVEVLVYQALEHCITDKLILSMARENGIDVPVEYDEIEKARESRNIEKEQAFADKKIVYGKKEFSEKEFLSNLVTNTRNDLINKLSKKEGQKLYVSKQEIKDYLEANQDEWKLYATQAEVLEVRLYNHTHPETAAADIETMLRQNLPVQAIKEKYKEDVETNTYTFTGESYSEDLKARYDVRVKADEMEQDEVTQVTNGDVVSVIKILNKTFDKNKSDDLYGTQIRSILAEEKLNKFLDNEYKKCSAESVDKGKLERLFKE